MLSHFFETHEISGTADLAAAAVRAAPLGASLSVALLERLAPRGHLKAGHPHVWERIWLFCTGPAHLERYLVSLSIQDRAATRAGLRPEAMREIADILAANQRFLAPRPAASVWDAAALKR